MRIIDLLYKFFGFSTPKSNQHLAEPALSKTTAEVFLAEPVIELQVSLDNDKVANNFVYVQPQNYPILLKTNVHKELQINTLVSRGDKGALEDYFFDFVRPVLGENFKNDVCIVLPNMSLTPDFAYIDSTSKKFIVIEIDEPYSIGDEGELLPIHYRGIDDRRNEALLLNGWNIVRFAEIQIAKHPRECQAIISSFIKNHDDSTIPVCDCWSIEDAEKMIKEKFRDTYLPTELKGAFKRGSKNSYRHLPVHYIRGITTKKGKNIVVVELELNKKNEGNNSYTFDQCSCYFKEEEFWERMEILKMDSVLKAKKNRHHPWCRYQIYIHDLYFEGYGEMVNNNFKLRDLSSFRLFIIETKHEQDLTNLEKIELLKRYGFKFDSTNGVWKV